MQDSGFGCRLPAARKATMSSSSASSCRKKLASVRSIGSEDAYRENMARRPREMASLSTSRAMDRHWQQCTPASLSHGHLGFTPASRCQASPAVARRCWRREPEAEQMKPGCHSTDSRARDRASAEAAGSSISGGGRRTAPRLHTTWLLRRLAFRKHELKSLSEHPSRARKKKSALPCRRRSAPHAARAYASGHQKDVVAPRQTFGRQPASMYSRKRRSW